MRKKVEGGASERSEDARKFTGGGTRNAALDLTCSGCGKTHRGNAVEVKGIGSFACPDCGTYVEHPWDRKATTEKVTVTFGEENYRLAQYCNCTIGPFTYETTVQEGETVQDALHRANEQLRKFARDARAEKIGEYLRVLKEVHGE